MKKKDSYNLDLSMVLSREKHSTINECNVMVKKKKKIYLARQTYP